MNPFIRLKKYIESWNQKEFRNYSLIMGSILMILISIIIFYYYYRITTLNTRIATINKNRITARSLISRYDLVKKQQIEVDAILAKEKDFKISQYFEQLLAKLDLTKNKAQDVDTRSEEVPRWLYRMDIVRNTH